MTRKSTTVNPFHNTPTRSMARVKEEVNPQFIGTAIMAGIAVASQVTNMIQKRKGEKRAEKLRLETEAINKKNMVSQNLATQVSGGGNVTSNGGNVNVFGVNTTAKGGFLAKGDMHEFKSGGTHEQHPWGGIPIGMGSNGKMNTVEQNETGTTIMIDGTPQKFIFSAQEKFENDGTLPKSLKSGKPYADVHKHIEKMFEGRLDKYSLDTKRILIEGLAKNQLKHNAKNNPESTNRLGSGSGYGDYPAGTYLDGTGRYWKNESEFLKASGYTSMFSDNAGKITDPIIKGATSGFSWSDEFNTIGEPNTVDEFGDVMLTSDGLPQKADVAMPELNLPTTNSSTVNGGGFNQWMDKNAGTIGVISAGVGALAQTAGIVSSIVGRNRVKDAGYDVVNPALVSKGGLNPYLVNRHSILNEINNAASTANYGAAEYSGGNLGMYASQVSANNSAKLKALSTAMLQSEIADSQEKGRVQQLGVNIDQFNASQVERAAEATAQNKGAYDSALMAYDSGIAGNTASLGQSLMNYSIAAASGKYMTYAEQMNALNANNR